MLTTLLRAPIVAAFVTLSLFILLWDVFLAGQIARVRSASAPFATLTALCGLLAIPAMLVAALGGSMTTGRTITWITWLWPLTACLFAVQAIYATTRRLVLPAIGAPIACYGALLAACAVTRYLVSLGVPLPMGALALSAAQASTLGALTGPAALWAPFAVQPPLLSPAYPARWRASKTIRAALGVLAAAWSLVTIVELPGGVRAVHSYDGYARELLQERPAGDFAVGLRLLPDVDAPPPPHALQSDLDLVDTTEADAVMVVVDPDGARDAALDSLGRALDQLRRDSTALVVAIGYPRDARERLHRSARAFTAAQVDVVERVARRLHPDILLPADEPYGRGAEALGVLPPSYWARYLTSAAARVRRVDRRIRIGVGASSYAPVDSALFEWAAAPRSPIDIVGFSLAPSYFGALALDARMRAADRWIRAEGIPSKDHWVWHASGLPATHGEQSQERAIWGMLTWATSHDIIKGLVVDGAGDYDSMTGLRDASGRLRRATSAVHRAVRGLREAQEQARTVAAGPG